MSAGATPGRGWPAAVLFDLDGTLIDSAPDLAGACNDLRAAHALPPLPYAALRPLVGSGARGMVGAGFGLAPGDAGYEALRSAFLAAYEARMTRETRVFDGIASLLDALDAARLPWGIVTNKMCRYAEPVVAALGLAPGVLIGGDSTPHAKPHPAPLLAAAARLAVPPEACLYVGDDRRDVEAGRAAGMATMVATWGYLGTGAAWPEWGADASIDAPGEFAASVSRLGAGRAGDP